MPELFLHEYCDRHDFDYWVGGTIADRWKADFGLWKRGMKAAGWNPLKQVAVLTYYAAVMACGATCFHYGTKRDEKDVPV